MYLFALIAFVCIILSGVFAGYRFATRRKLRRNPPSWYVISYGLPALVVAVSATVIAAYFANALWETDSDRITCIDEDGLNHCSTADLDKSLLLVQPQRDNSTTNTDPVESSAESYEEPGENICIDIGGLSYPCSPGGTPIDTETVQFEQDVIHPCVAYAIQQDANLMSEWQ